MACKCLSEMACYDPESFGVHHHRNCEKYATEKNKILFFYDDSVDCWLMTDTLEVADWDADPGEVFEIQFRFELLTDQELD